MNTCQTVVFVLQIYFGLLDTAVLSVACFIIGSISRRLDVESFLWATAATTWSLFVGFLWSTCRCGLRLRCCKCKTRDTLTNTLGRQSHQLQLPEKSSPRWTNKTIYWELMLLSCELKRVIRKHSQMICHAQQIMLPWELDSRFKCWELWSRGTDRISVFAHSPKQEIQLLSVSLIFAQELINSLPLCVSGYRRLKELQQPCLTPAS